MDAPQSTQPITMDEAWHVVHSLHERVRRLGDPEPEPVSPKFSAVAMGTVALGAAFTAAVFSPNVSDRFRWFAATGAILSTGAAVLLATSAYVSQPAPISMENELRPIMSLLDIDHDLREELAKYLTEHITRKDLVSGEQGDAFILQHVRRFGEIKGAIRHSVMSPLLAEKAKSWEERSYSEGAGKNLFLSGAS